jgi:Rv0078B-related antitoxin
MTLYDQPIHDPKVFERAQATFELLELAEKIMRQNIRRRHPQLSEEEVEQRLVEWYRRRPDDSYGRPSRERPGRNGQ